MMKNTKLVSLLALAAALFASGCAFNPQSVTFNRSLSVAAAPLGAGKTISVVGKDDRADLALGRRNGVMALISTSESMGDVVRDKFAAGLTQMGFKIDPASDHKVVVELRLLSYGTSMGFWTGGVNTKGAIKVTATSGTEKFEKNYNADAEERVMVVPTAEHNAELLNVILDQTLLKVFTDEEFRAFIAR